LDLDMHSISLNKKTMDAFLVDFLDTFTYENLSAGD